MRYFTIDKEKAACLNVYFAFVSTVDESEANLTLFKKKKKKKNNDKYIEIIIIFEKEVKDILDILNVDKAADLDMINKKTFNYHF